MDQYLAETYFMDYNSPEVQATLDKLGLDGLSEKDKAIKLFYFVRDATKYSIKGVGLLPEIFRASTTLQKQHSFCIPKATLLATLARAVGIPSRLHLVDFVNHRLSPELTKMWGTNVMAAHCYAELYINDKWVKATPALDKQTCDTHEFVTVEFDGEHDALLSPVDRNGNPHAEYVKDHGTFADVPLDRITEIFKETYPEFAKKLQDQIFDAEVKIFQN